MIYHVLRPILENFANFVLPVLNAGATYCRRKCFRAVLGRECGSFQDQEDNGGTRHLYGSCGRTLCPIPHNCTGVEYRAFISDRVLPQPSSGTFLVKD